MNVRLRSDLGLPCMEVMNFLNEAADRHRMAISLAAGRPPDRFVSAEETGAWITRFVEHRRQVTGLSEEAVWRSLGQYGAATGMIGELVAQMLARDEGLNATSADLLITNGMQEALLVLLLGVCSNAESVILSDDPSYVGLRGAAVLVGADVVPLGGAGTIVDRTERALAMIEAGGRWCRALYVIPDFSNPSGRTLSLGEREALLVLAERAGILLIEDTAYRAFRYEGEQLPTLKALDRGGFVVQVGSFAKLFMPGPRVGYLYADQRAEVGGRTLQRTVAQELSKVKSFVSVLTSPVVQAMVGGFLLEHDFSLRSWNRRRIEACRSNRDAMLASLEKHFGSDRDLRDRVAWSRPEGGFFLTMTVPFEFGSNEMMTCARDYGVIVCPMSYFSSAPESANSVRLSFSNVTAREVDEGTARLHRFVHHQAGSGAC